MITEIAGGVALVVYRFQRRMPNDMDFMSMRFRYNQADWKDEPSYDEFQQTLVKIADNNLADLQNAIEYLSDEGLMTFTDDSDNAQRGYRNFHLTARAIRIIEGVENTATEANKQFNLTFNFKLESLVKIDSILQSLFGIKA